MPPPPSITPIRLERQLQYDGPLAAGELRRRLGLSPASLSRGMAVLGEKVVAFGKTRAREYGLRRPIPGLPAVIPVYTMEAPGPRLFGTLEPVWPRGFLVRGPASVAGFHPDLPWFLNDLRPAGFLGRLAPLQHPELGLPPDILTWSGDDALVWLHAWGMETVGCFVVGDPSFSRLESAALPAMPRDAYPALAAAIMAPGAPGSSAAGEQPKFLALRADGPTPVLVKFAPEGTDPTARRWADLLRCEHHALCLLRESGVPAAASTIVVAGDRTFLEVERFDRVGQHRLGMISLRSVARHTDARRSCWTHAADDLLRHRHIRAEDHERIYFLDRFGELIGNTDRHAGNLSFALERGVVGALTPVYDMLPMRYAIRAGAFQTPVLTPPIPTPTLADAWRAAWALAIRFWTTVADDEAVAVPLRDVARANADALTARQDLVDRLPAPPVTRPS